MNIKRQPEIELLERNRSLFQDKSTLILGDCYDGSGLKQLDLPLHWHTTDYHRYLKFKSLGHPAIHFSLFPDDELLKTCQQVIFFWPKAKAEAFFVLDYLAAKLPLEVDLFVVGENRSGVNSVKTRLDAWARVNHIDTARRSNLYYLNRIERPPFDITQYWKRYELPSSLLTHVTPYFIEALPGVFSQSHLDEGTALLLESMNQHLEIVKGRVLDLGCGAGVIARHLLAIHPDIQMVATDVNAAALRSTQHNTEIFENIQIQASDIFSEIEGKFDLIISNPPFHDGRHIDYRAVEHLIQNAQKHLIKGGYFCLVANRFLAYEDWLQQTSLTLEWEMKTETFKVYALKMSPSI